MPTFLIIARIIIIIRHYNSTLKNGLPKLSQAQILSFLEFHIFTLLDTSQQYILQNDRNMKHDKEAQFPKGIQNSLFPNVQNQQIIITNYKKVLMNLAIFLHSKKQFKDSTLPLPLAPTFCLPHQKWYFSSPALTPLRKRRQNTSLFKFLQEITPQQQKNPNKNNANSNNNNAAFLCIYEKNCFFDNKIKHIFDLIYSQSNCNLTERQKIKCECAKITDKDSSKHFFTDTKAINDCLKQSKKSFKNETAIQQQDKINWYQFTRKILNKHLDINSYGIHEQSLYLYRLPDEDYQKVSIFNVLWSNNYLIFNNGKEVNINHHMKSKAVQLCELVNKKMQQEIWTLLQSYIPKIAEELKQHDRFMDILKKRTKISTFKLWFYKKQENNEIYILNLSNLTFKGVQCVVQNNFDLKTNRTIEIYEKGKEGEQEKLLDITELHKSLENKVKLETANIKYLSIPKPQGQDRPRQSNIKISEYSNADMMLTKPEVKLTIKNDLSDIQCACCKDLLANNEIINEVVAKHIEQIRYLRQFKIGKQDYSPYDFVKVCTACYKIYLKHHRQRTSLDKNKKDLEKEKKSYSFFEKKSLNFQSYKSKNDSLSIKMRNDSSKKLFAKAEMLRERAKSELNRSKEQQQIQKEQKPVPKDRSISVKPSFCPPRPIKGKKTNTTYTTNTQNTLNHRQQIGDLNNSRFVIQRSRTQQQNVLLNNNNILFKSKAPNNSQKLINKIISHSFQNKIRDVTTEQGEQQKAIHNINTKIIMNAIDQYQKIDRMSFKKIITKNQRHYLIRQPSKQGFQKQDMNQMFWKKPIKAYFEN